MRVQVEREEATIAMAIEAAPMAEVDVESDLYQAMERTFPERSTDIMSKVYKTLDELLKRYKFLKHPRAVR